MAPSGRSCGYGSTDYVKKRTGRTLLSFLARGRPRKR